MINGAISKLHEYSKLSILVYDPFIDIKIDLLLSMTTGLLPSLRANSNLAIAMFPKIAFADVQRSGWFKT